MTFRAGAGSHAFGAYPRIRHPPIHPPVRSTIVVDLRPLIVLLLLLLLLLSSHSSSAPLSRAPTYARGAGQKQRP
eukprot:938448-Pyramimonas_sp.AAC.2